jgi:hypothetical protein
MNFGINILVCKISILYAPLAQIIIVFRLTAELKENYCMKNWKHWTFAAIIAICGIIFGFIACDHDNGNKDPCNCDPKAHLGIGEICNCGGNDCTCIEQIGDVGGVTIRKAAGISVNDMTDAIDDLIIPTYNTGYLGTSEQKASFVANTTAIHITKTGKAWSFGTDRVLTINLDIIDEAKLGSAFFNIQAGMPPGYDIDGPIM